MNVRLRCGWVFALVTLATGCSSQTGIETTSSTAQPTYDTTIRWTSFGIPHVTANDWASLGYGYAYATAKDGLCVIARDLVTARGEQARFFPEDDGALAADVFHTGLIDAAKLAEFSAAQDEQTTVFNQGYADGYNRYLAEHADEASTCKDAPWVRPIDLDDVVRLQIGVGIRYGLGLFADEIAGARPPSADVAANSAPTQFGLPAGIGSNAIAIGSNASHNGRGILFGNPHYPWHGPSRFHMIHTTIPGELDVMGVSLLNTNRVAIGFNENVAWTHTVSTATRFTLYRLVLNPDNPMQYQVDGEFRDMQPLAVEVATADGASHTQPIYLTHFGPVVSSAQLPWNNQVAFALRDAVIDNYQTGITYGGLNAAKSISDIEAALHHQGVYWTNTIAADKDGTAYYADISGTPNLSAETLKQCQIQNDQLPRGIIMLDGTRTACEWTEDARAKVPGTLPAEEMPRIATSDYVTNSNDSYWLSNPNEPLEGYSPIIGDERTARTLRTRAGLAYMHEIMARQDRFAPQNIRDLLYSHRNYGAELLLDNILSAICPDNDELARGCQALSDWDRTMNVDSKGGHLWREFWNTARRVEDLYAVAFDANDPMNTPRGISDDEAVHQQLAASLSSAVDKLDNAGIALDARLGDIQYAARNGNNIPVPGGEGWAGMFSMIRAELDNERGYAPIFHGNSYIQVVSWDDDGKVVPTGILTYSQSPEPTSPHYSDQTELYAQGEWLQLPFYEEDIVADPNLTTLRLTE